MNLSDRITRTVLCIMIDAIENACPTIGGTFLAPETVSAEEVPWMNAYHDLNFRLFELHRVKGNR